LSDHNAAKNARVNATARGAFAAEAFLKKLRQKILHKKWATAFQFLFKKSNLATAQWGTPEICVSGLFKGRSHVQFSGAFCSQWA
jgi:hypothetical protein